MNSGLFKITLTDTQKAFIGGILSAILTPVLSLIGNSLSDGALPDLVSVKAALLVGITTTVASLIRRFTTNSDGKFLTPEGK